MIINPTVVKKGGGAALNVFHGPGAPPADEPQGFFAQVPEGFAPSGVVVDSDVLANLGEAETAIVSIDQPEFPTYSFVYYDGSIYTIKAGSGTSVYKINTQTGAGSSIASPTTDTIFSSVCFLGGANKNTMIVTGVRAYSYGDSSAVYAINLDTRNVATYLRSPLSLGQSCMGFAQDDRYGYVLKQNSTSTVDIYRVDLQNPPYQAAIWKTLSGYGSVFYTNYWPSVAIVDNKLYMLGGGYNGSNKSLIIDLETSAVTTLDVPLLNNVQSMACAYGGKIICFVRQGNIIIFDTATNLAIDTGQTSNVTDANWVSPLQNAGDELFSMVYRVYSSSPRAIIRRYKILGKEYPNNTLVYETGYQRRPVGLVDTEQLKQDAALTKAYMRTDDRGLIALPSYDRKLGESSWQGPF